MAEQQKYSTLKADVFVQERGSSEAPHYVGNVPAATVAMTIESVTLQSDGNESGELAKDETSRSATLSLTLNSLTARNMSMYLYGDVQQQASATAQAATLPAGDAGDALVLSHTNVSAVTVEGLTEGVDYKVLAKGGVIVLLKDLAADADVTYSAGTSSVIGLLANSGKEYTVTIVSEKTGIRAVLSRWKPDPAQSLDLISREFAAPQVSGTLLIDESLPDGPLGRYGEFRNSN